ncbi:hypothetical protein E3Q18_00876 [Wallemia mellicola]|nr:hypothetical protein E3Q18_00876 [Wallemia mellicola]
MGRRKIQIKPLKDDRNRSVTFLKRKTGLFKKAHELGVLCSADVAVIVFGHNGKLYEFSSGNIEKILMKYTEHEGESERRCPRDFNDDNESEQDFNEFEEERVKEEPEVQVKATTETPTPVKSEPVKEDIKEDIKPRIEIGDLDDKPSSMPSTHAGPSSSSLPPPPRSPKPVSPFDPSKYSPYPPLSFLPGYPHSPNTQAQHDQMMNWQYAQMHAHAVSQHQQQQTRPQQSTNQFLSPSNTPVVQSHSPQASQSMLQTPNVSSVPNMGSMPWYNSMPPIAWPTPAPGLSASMLMDPFQFPLDGLSTSPSDGQSGFQWPIPPKEATNQNNSTTAAGSEGELSANSGTTLEVPNSREPIQSPRSTKRARTN